MLVLTLKLILSHILGDFLLQPETWVKGKNEYKHRSKYMYRHIAVHLISLIIALKFDVKYILGVLVIVLSHLIIDLVKVHLNETFSKRILFFTDQFLHLLVILSVVYYYNPFEVDFTKIYTPTTILFFIAILLATSVSSIILKVVISKWDPEGVNTNKENTEASLPNAGSYIGMLERLFIFGFILANQWSGIGFLIAAKSIFRFGDLSKAKDRKLTEYILIGTLLSFGLAIIIAKGYQYVYKLLG